MLLCFTFVFVRSSMEMMRSREPGVSGSRLRKCQNRDLLLFVPVTLPGHRCANMSTQQVVLNVL